MGMNAAAYLQQLQALMPLGAAWTRDPDAELTALLQAWADEFARVDGRHDDLVRELDPRTATELLPDWEEMLGLPGPCITGELTLDQRRAAAYAALTSKGSLSPSFYIQLAAALGFEVTVTEYGDRNFEVDHSTVEMPLVDGWRFVWRVNAPETTIREFAVEANTVEEPLATWGNETLECAIRATGPAGTDVYFAYGA